MNQQLYDDFPRQRSSHKRKKGKQKFKTDVKRFQTFADLEDNDDLYGATHKINRVKR